MQSPTVETAITIFSRSVELDFAALTRISERVADSTRSLSHVLATGKPSPVRCSEWTISTGPQILDSVDAGVQQVLGLISASAPSLAALCRSNGYEVEVTSRVRTYDWDDRPFVALGAPSMELLQQLGAGWQLDWIDLSR